MAKETNPETLLYNTFLYTVIGSVLFIAASAFNQQVSDVLVGTVRWCMGIVS